MSNDERITMLENRLVDLEKKLEGLPAAVGVLDRTLAGVMIAVNLCEVTLRKLAGVLGLRIEMRQTRPDEKPDVEITPAKPTKGGCLQ